MKDKPSLYKHDGCDYESIEEKAVVVYIDRPAIRGTVSGDKTSMVLPAKCQMQKGDIFTFRKNNEFSESFGDFDELRGVVFEVTYVYGGEGLREGHIIVCFKRRDDLLFVAGDINSDVQTDTLFKKCEG